MGDFAGVDPHRVRLLADRLKDLANTLGKEGATIRKLFSDWDGAIDQSLLVRQANQVHDDARDMSRRADESLNLLHQPRFVDPNDPHRNWITIPWDVSRINTIAEAQQEAANLKVAMDTPDGTQSLATIAEVAQVPGRSPGRPRLPAVVHELRRHGRCRACRPRPARPGRYP
jgi:hypothetical protein